MSKLKVQINDKFRLQSTACGRDSSLQYSYFGSWILFDIWILNFEKQSFKNMSMDLLRQCPLFAGLQEKGLQKIKAIALPRQFKRREVLFCDGEEAKGFYVILSGRVKLYKISPEGKEQILHVVSAPDAFAEAALFFEGTYPAFAEALSDSQLLFFPKRNFIELIGKDPQLSINMIVSLSQYLKRFASLIEELSLKEVSSRIAKYLLDLSLKLSKGKKSPGK